MAHRSTERHANRSGMTAVVAGDIGVADARSNRVEHGERR
jgi:hypothetical protein